jgi:proteasome regulatory subunit
MPSNNKDKESPSASFSYHSQMFDGVVHEENKVLRTTISELREEVQRFHSPSLMLAEVFETYEDKAVIKVPNGNRFLVNISKMVTDLRSGDQVAVEQRNLTIVKKLNKISTFDVEKFVIVEKPDKSWNEVGGLDEQIRLVREIIELPLIKPELFQRIGIEPPKGILLHGPPGTGKTLIAKAVAHSTQSTFIQVVGSELVQKFIGEGAKLVKEIFEMARAKAPAIVFIDEIDALAAKRIDLGTSGEREVQRTFMQLLSEIDGFKPLDNVKIIGCTNRIDILDPAILRPGRLDRLIEIPVPKIDGIKQILNIHTKKMNVTKVNFEQLGCMLVGMTGADIKYLVTEAGYCAIRKNKSTVCHEDFMEAFANSKYQNATEKQEYLHMFG